MLALLQFSLVVGISFIRLRIAFYLFIFFLAFAPRSMGLILSNGSVSLSFVRITFPILFILFVTALMLRKTPGDRIKPRLSSLNPFRLLAILSVTKVIATSANGVVPSYALEDLLLSTAVFFCFYRISTERVAKTLIVVMSFSVAITGLFVAMEIAIGRPLHYFFANQTLIQQETLLLHSREGQQRVQGIFDNPLSLAEFGVYALPIILYFTLIYHKGNRIIGIGLTLILVFTIFQTGSRSGVLAIFLVAGAFMTTFYWVRFSSISRAVLVLLFVVVFSFALLSAFGVLLSLIGSARETTLYLVDNEAQRSTLYRALQYYEVYSTIIERPLGGFGVLQNFSNELDVISSIDNYYLRVALEAGIPALTLFLMFILSLFRLINRLARTIGDSREDRLFHAMCVGLLIAFATMKLFLSMPTNNVFFYALMGSFLAVMARRAALKRNSDTDSVNLL